MAEHRIEITGEGSIREIKKGRVYYVRHRLPPVEPGGKRRWSPNRKVYGNKAKARQELEIYRKELEAELNGEIGITTLGEYAMSFHEHRRCSNTVTLRTLERESYEISRIVNTLGSVLIEKVTPAQIVDAYSGLRKEGASQNTINSLHVKLSQILERAYREGLIVRNPCKLIDATEVRRQKSASRKALSAEQFTKLANDLLAAKIDGRIVAVWIAMAVGGRRGEILGLEWGDIDLDKGMISFNAQLTPKQGRITRLKTDESRRVCAIDNSTVAFLGNWKAYQSHEFYGGKPVPDNAPVCCNEMGRYMSLSNFDRWRRRFFVEHGLGVFKVVEEHRDKTGRKRYRYSGYEGFCLHELRHSQATLLIASHIDPKTVQARGGWASIDVPMNIYTHSVEENDREAAETIGGYLPRVAPLHDKTEQVVDIAHSEAANVDGRQSKSFPVPDDILVEHHRPRCKPISKEQACQRILHCLEQRSAPVSKREISEATSIKSAKCLSTTLVSLQRRGLVKKIGGTKSARYSLEQPLQLS